MVGFPRDLGMVSAKYESGGRGVDFISNGSSWGDPGGDSYGIHQLSGAYSMGAFLRSKWGAPYKAKFGSLTPGTNSFNRKYKQVAKADPEGFAYAQKAFYATTHYVPLRDHAKAKGFDVNDRGVQEALFSMSVQHGGAKKIVNAVVDEEGVPNHPAEQVKALFRERTEYVNGLRSLSTKLKRNITQNRYRSEVRDCLELVGEVEDIEDVAVSPSPTLDQDVGDSFSNIISIFMRALNTIFGLFGRAKETVGEVIETAKEIDIIDDINLDKIADNLKGERETPWMATAKKLVGTKEIAGRRSNSKIMSWAKALGSKMRSIYTNDDIAWCGLFVAHIMNENGIKHGLSNALGARNWGKFGEPCEPQYGAVMTFWRGKKSGWTGHVGLYVSEDSKYYHILGGNQSNSVNVTKISKTRFLKARWPSGYDTLKKRLAGRIVKKFDGKVSTNEA